MHGQCTLHSTKFGKMDNPRVVSISSLNNSTFSLLGTREKSSYKNYVLNFIFSANSPQKQCSISNDIDNVSFVKSVNNIEGIVKSLNSLIKKNGLNLPSINLQNLHNNNIPVSNVRENLMNAFVGRKLLSVDQCDSENCQDENINHVRQSDSNNDRVETDDYEETDEDYSDYEYDDDESEGLDEFLDEEDLEDLLKNKDPSEYAGLMNDLLDNLEIVMKSGSKSDDFYISGIQSLLVYIAEVENWKNGKIQSSEMGQLADRIENLKLLYLSQLTHFEIFFKFALDNFTALGELETFDGKNKENIRWLNNFIFNFHYASEIENIINRRNIPDEVEILEDYEAEMKVMYEAFFGMGFGEEVQDENYFAKYLSADSDDDDADVHQSRKLLSLSADKLKSVNEADINHNLKSFMSRKLLSIKDNNFCEKDDIECNKKASENMFDSDKNFVKEVQNKDVIIEDSNEDTDQGSDDTDKRNDLQTGLPLCHKFLAKSKKQLESMSELASQIESIKSLKPKKKVKLIQKFMTFMTALKLLFNEYQEIESSIKRHDDLTLCQPILKGSMRKLFLNYISFESRVGTEFSWNVLEPKTLLGWKSSLKITLNLIDPYIIQNKFVSRSFCFESYHLLLIVKVNIYPLKMFSSCNRKLLIT